MNEIRNKKYILFSAPSGQIVPSRITGSPGGSYEIEFTPMEPGPFRVDVNYACVHVPSSPLVVMAYDVSRIRVLGVVDGLVGQKSAFSGTLNFLRNLFAYYCGSFAQVFK